MSLSRVADNSDNGALTFYPPVVYHLSLTFRTWARLSSFDIQHRLRRHPSASCPNTWFLLNHPIRYVRVIGLVVAFDVWEKRTRLTVDDGSGEMLNLIVSPSGEERWGLAYVPLGGVRVGKVIKAKGEISEFRGCRQMLLRKCELVEDTRDEVKYWIEMNEFRRRLASPWWVEKRTVRRELRKREKQVKEREKAEREEEGIEKKAGFIGRRREGYVRQRSPRVKAELVQERDGWTRKADDLRRRRSKSPSPCRDKDWPWRQCKPLPEEAQNKPIIKDDLPPPALGGRPQNKPIILNDEPRPPRNSREFTAIDSGLLSSPRVSVNEPVIISDDHSQKESHSLRPQLAEFKPPASPLRLPPERREPTSANKPVVVPDSYSLEESHFSGRRRPTGYKPPALPPERTMQDQPQLPSPLAQLSPNTPIIVDSEPDKPPLSISASLGHRRRHRPPSLKSELLAHMRNSGAIIVTFASLSRVFTQPGLRGAIGGLVGDGYLLPARRKGLDEWKFVGEESLKDIVARMTARKGRSVKGREVWRVVKGWDGWEGVGKEVVAEVVEALQRD